MKKQSVISRGSLANNMLYTPTWGGILTICYHPNRQELPFDDDMIRKKVETLARTEKKTYLSDFKQV